MLDVAFGAAQRPTRWRAEFWTRLPHPDTGIAEHGPEADVTLAGDDGSFYAVEAKWLSDIPPTQGRSQRITQLEMRTASVRARCADPSRRGVLVVAPGPARYPHANRLTSTFSRYFAVSGDTYVPRSTAVALETRAVTWEQIARMLAGMPRGNVVGGYLAWRLGLLDSATT